MKFTNHWLYWIAVGIGIVIVVISSILMGKFSERIMFGCLFAMIIMFLMWKPENSLEG